MDVMQLRRNLLMMQGKPYEMFSFSMDGSAHNSNIIVPTKNVTILVELGGASNTTGNPTYVDTSLTTNNSANRYLQIAFYTSFAYFDVGGRRATYYVSNGYDITKTNRFGVSIGSDGSFYHHINSYVSSKVYINTTSSLTDIGTLRGNRDSRSNGNAITVYFYNKALTEAEVANFCENGIIPN